MSAIDTLAVEPEPEDPERRYRRLLLLFKIVRRLADQLQTELDDLALAAYGDDERLMTEQIDHGVLHQAALMLRQHPAITAQLELLLPYIEVTRGE